MYDLFNAANFFLIYSIGLKNISLLFSKVEKHDSRFKNVKDLKIRSSIILLGDHLFFYMNS